MRYIPHEYSRLRSTRALLYIIIHERTTRTYGRKPIYAEIRMRIRHSLHNPSAILPITRACIDNRTLTSAHVSQSIDSRSSINRYDFLFRMLNSDASSSPRTCKRSTR